MAENISDSVKSASRCNKWNKFLNLEVVSMEQIQSNVKQLLLWEVLRAHPSSLHRQQAL